VLIVRYYAGCLVTSCVGVCAAAGAQTVRGTITDTAGMRIPNAEVRFITPNGNATIAVSHVAARGTSFSISAPPPEGRYVVYYVAACAEGYAPQVVTAPYGRGDTLKVSFELARTTQRPTAVSVGSGMCRWQTDSVVRVTVKRTGTFPSRAALTVKEMDNMLAALPNDTATRRAHVNRLMAREDSALRRAATDDARQQVAYTATLALGVYTGPAPTKLRARVAAALPPTSRWWASRVGWVSWGVTSLFDPPVAGDTSPAAKATRSQIQSYLQRMALIGEPEIRSEARAELVRYTAAAGDSVRAQLLATQLIKEQPNYMYSRILAGRYSRARALQTGHQFPAFSFAPLPDTSGERITNVALRSRFTIVDFWGTWCAECIGELPSLAKIYAAYHPSGLEILSIAANAEPADVNEFRHTRYPMPWLNAFGGAADAPALQRLGVVTYPTKVLVDSVGMIVASGNALSPDSLESTIRQFMSRK
jgi:thiol-disulfide isomerase/thioredoxin